MNAIAIIPGRIRMGADRGPDLSPLTRKFRSDPNLAREILGEVLSPLGYGTAVPPPVKDMEDLADTVARAVGATILGGLSLDDIRRVAEALHGGSLTLTFTRSVPTTSPTTAPPVDGALTGEPVAMAAPEDARHARRVAEATERAVERGRRAVHERLAGPGMLTGEEFGRRVGVSRDTVNRWRRDSRIVALEGAKRGVRYPDWQITDGRLIEGIERIAAAGRDRPWTAHAIMSEPQPELDGRTGLDAAKEGRLDMVIAMIEDRGTGFS